MTDDDLEALKQDLVEVMDETQAFVEANRRIYGHDSENTHALGFSDGMKDARKLLELVLTENFGDEVLEETRSSEEISDLIDEEFDMEEHLGQ